MSTQSNSIKLNKISTYDAMCKGSGCVEVLSFDKQTQTINAILRRDSTVVVLKFKNHRLAEHGRIPIGSPKSITTCKGYMAVSLGHDNHTSGFLRLYDIKTLAMTSEVLLSSMPGMILFSKDGTKIYVAGKGTFSIVYLTWIKSIPFIHHTKELIFQDYIDQISSVEFANKINLGLRVDPRLGGKDKAGLDIEPDYIAISNDDNIAYVTLQDNNAIGVINLENERILDIWPMGSRDLSKSQADLSPVDGINMRNWNNVYMWHQPYSIVYHTIAGRGYVFTTNKGDTKEEKIQVRKIAITAWETTAFPNATILKSKAELGSVRFDPLWGLENGYDTSVSYDQQTGYNKMFIHGSRSFSIHDAVTGDLVYNSGEWMERITTQHESSKVCFNCERDTNIPDSRSPFSGIEPKALAVFFMYGTTYLAVGLERQSGFMIFNADNVSDPMFVEYIVDRNFSIGDDESPELLGNLAPEMIKFVSTRDSPTHAPLLLVTYEISGHIVVYEFTEESLTLFLVWLCMIAIMLFVSLMIALCLNLKQPRTDFEENLL